MNISILGVGSWGSALALVLSENKNCNISMYHHNNYYDDKSSFKYLEKTKIPRNVRVSEAPSHGRPVLIYDHQCVGAQAYIQLASEVLKREEGEKYEFT